MNMTPSKSSLDRLPKQLSGRWEAERELADGAKDNRDYMDVMLLGGTG